jgi:hypothetical protein
MIPWIVATLAVGILVGFVAGTFFGWKVWGAREKPASVSTQQSTQPKRNVRIPA